MHDKPQGDILEELRSSLFLVYAVLAIVFGWVLALRDGEDAEVTAKIESEARDRKAVRPEELYHGAPNNFLTSPLQDTK